MQIKKLLLTLLTLVCTVLAGQAETTALDLSKFDKEPTISSYQTRTTEGEPTGVWTAAYARNDISITSAPYAGRNILCLKAKDGKLTSPTLKGGIQKIRINTICPFSEKSTKIDCEFKLTPKGSQTNKAIRIVRFEQSGLTSKKEYPFELTLSEPIDGDFELVLELTNSTARVGILALEWDTYSSITPTDATFGWKDAAGNAVTSWVKPLKDAQLPTFSASGTHEDGTALDVTKIAYSSSNPAVVAYEGGKFVAKGTGTVTLTAALTGDSHFNDFTSSIDVTLNGACAPATVSPDNSLPVLEGTKLSFTCPQEGAKLNLMVGDDFLEEGLALPYEYTLATAGSYSVLYSTTCENFSESEQTALTYQVISAATVGTPVFSLDTNSKVDYNTPLEFTAVNAAKLEAVVEYADGLTPETETKTFDAASASLNLTRDCMITVNAFRADETTAATTASAIYTINRAAAPTLSNDGADLVAYNAPVTITAAAGCTVKYQIDTTEPVTVATNSTTINITEDCELKAWSVMANSYESAVTSATYLIQRPEAPSFSLADNAEVALGSTLNITAAADTKLRYQIDGSEAVNCEGNTATLTLEYDGKVTAWSVLPNGYTNEGTAAISYKIQRPAAPTFSIAAGNVEQGTNVTITAPTGSTFSYRIGEVVTNTSATTAKVQIVENTTIVAWSELSNGYKSTEVTATYTSVTPAPAVNPVPSAADGQALFDNTEITFTSANADKMVLKAYTFDGSFTTTEADGNTIKGTFTKDVRRFVVQGIRNVYGNNNGASDVLDIQYDIRTCYRRVTDVSQLKAGMKFVIGVPTKNVLMSNTPTINTNDEMTSWKTTTYSFKANSEVISSCPASVMVIQLEASEKPDVWYLKSLDATYPGYFCKGGDDSNNYLTLSATPSETKISFNKSGAVIEIAVPDGQTKRLLQFNPSASPAIFSMYKNSQTTPNIYALEGENEAPVVTFKHRRYDWRGFHDPETEHATEAVTDADGMTTYTAQGVYNLAGDFKLFMNGTAVGGHIDQAKTDFALAHGDAELKGTNCVGEHAPYVYVQQNTPYTLFTAKEGQDIVPLSTSPDRYHYGNDVHTTPIVKVMHKPFHSLQLMVEGEAGGSVTSVANVAVDADAPVMLFNLQGQPVDATHPAPGIYLRRQGSRTDKVVIE